MALGGDAVGRLPSDDPARAGPVLFVPFGAPGDRVVLASLDTKKSPARGWIAHVTESSPHRVPPPCPHFFQPGRSLEKTCGGCQWQHLSTEMQKKAKKDLVVESFQRIARIAHPAVEDTRGADTDQGRWHYRNKVQIPFARLEDGSLTGGFYAPGTRTVVPFDDCPVQDERSLRAFRSVRDYFQKKDVTVYDPKTDQGWLRHLVVRTATTGDTLVALVTQSGPVPEAEEFEDHLQKTCPFVTSVYQNINDRPGNVVLGPRWKLLGGKPYLEEKLLGLRFRLSPASFFQVNHAMAEKLYTLAVEMAAPTAFDVAWELYAGVGAMAQLLAQKARTVWAVEENDTAVKDGLESVKMNKVNDVRFRSGPCEQVLARNILKDKPIIVLLDPPRAGCSPQVLKEVMRANPQRIVYVSCDPGTLARDARYLSTGGYHLKRCVPVDLFPQTAHIESVSLFERVGVSKIVDKKDLAGDSPLPPRTALQKASKEEREKRYKPMQPKRPVWENKRGPKPEGTDFKKGPPSYKPPFNGTKDKPRSKPWQDQKENKPKNLF